jgi:hypothetical protein
MRLEPLAPDKIARLAWMALLGSHLIPTIRLGPRQETGNEFGRDVYNVAFTRFPSSFVAVLLARTCWISRGEAYPDFWGRPSPTSRHRCVKP